MGWRKESGGWHGRPSWGLGLDVVGMSLGDAPGMVMPPSILLSNKGREAALSDQEFSQSGANLLEVTWTQRKNRGHLVEL